MVETPEPVEEWTKTPRVVLITTSTHVRDDTIEWIGYEQEEIVLYRGRRIMDVDIDRIDYLYGRETAYDIAKKEHRIDLDVWVQLGETMYKRWRTIELPKNERKVVEEWHHEKQDKDRFRYAIRQHEWYNHIIRVVDETEKSFCLGEDEMLDRAYDLIKGEYEWTHIKQQQNIGERRADAVVFCKDKRIKGPEYKIVGFEAKTDKDNYTRLYDQLDEYQMLCDEVYVVLENHDPPEDLPRHVGIIKVTPEGASIVRRAYTLNHDLQGMNWWECLKEQMLKDTGVHKKELRGFYHMVEGMKRKMAYNQIVVGWTGGTSFKISDEHMRFSDEEKELLRAYTRILEQRKDRKKKLLQEVMG